MNYICQQAEIKLASFCFVHRYNLNLTASSAGGVVQQAQNQSQYPTVHRKDKGIE